MNTRMARRSSEIKKEDGKITNMTTGHLAVQVELKGRESTSSAKDNMPRDVRLREYTSNESTDWHCKKRNQVETEEAQA